MANADVSQRVGEESARRVRLGVPSVAAGILYLLSAIIISSVLRGAPTVGVLQGLGPALTGKANPAFSPRAAEVRFESHQAFGLIAGSVLSSIAIVLLAVILLFLLRAATFRRPQTNRSARPLILIGGGLIALLTVVNEVVLAIRRHNFATGHVFTTHAVNAITHNAGYDVLAIMTPLAGIALVAGMIMTVIATVRVGLLPRWMGMVGGVSAVLLLLPAPTLDLIPAFWLVATGLLLMERWPKGDPPAWAAGAAVPWPSPATVRAEQAQLDGKRSSQSQEKGELSPEPSLPASTQTGKRRRKRGSRR
jgi:hypothetical protein